MTDPSPYSPPEAELEKPVEARAFQLRDPISVPISSGWGWIAKGFSIFKQDPGGWILLLFVGLAIMIALGLIPIIGQIVSMVITYVWIGGIMVGCRDRELGKPFTVEYLFAGFSNSTGKLILLSVIMTVISVGIMFAMLGSLYFSMLTGDAAGSQELMSDPMAFMFSILIAFLIMIPVVMAVWFAPALIVLNQVSVVQALKLSFFGCLKNILPFILYFVISMVLYIISAIPLLLGLLVFFPTMFASMYAAYKEIFIESEPLDG